MNMFEDVLTAELNAALSADLESFASKVGQAVLRSFTMKADGTLGLDGEDGRERRSPGTHCWIW